MLQLSYNTALMPGETKRGEDRDIYWNNLRTVHKRVMSAVATYQTDPTALVDILEATDLPMGAEFSEPWQVIITASNDVGDHSQRAKLAVQLGKLLDRGIDTEPIGKNLEKLRFNALALAEAMQYNDELVDPLERMYQRKKLAGSYNGEDLRSTLRSAMQVNQVDARHQTKWINMLDGNEDEFIGGTPIDGFRGIIFMPATQEARGLPNMEMIGVALDKMARSIAASDQSVGEFVTLLQQATHVYLQGGENYYNELYEQALKHEWPQWAVHVLAMNKQTIKLYGWA